MDLDMDLDILRTKCCSTINKKLKHDLKFPEQELRKKRTEDYYLG